MPTTRRSRARRMNGRSARNLVLTVAVALAVPVQAVASGHGDPAPTDPRLDAAVVIGLEASAGRDVVPGAAADAAAFAQWLATVRGVPSRQLTVLSGSATREDIVAALGHAEPSPGGIAWLYFSGPVVAVQPAGGAALGVDVEHSGQPHDGVVTISEALTILGGRGRTVVLVVDGVQTDGGLGASAFARALPPPTSPVIAWVSTAATAADRLLPAHDGGALTWTWLGAVRGWADTSPPSGVVTTSEVEGFVADVWHGLAGAEARSLWVHDGLLTPRRPWLAVASPEPRPADLSTERVDALDPARSTEVVRVAGGPWSAAQGIEVVRVPAGTFVMGTRPDEPEHVDDEGPVDVTISRPFLIMRTEVTQAVWRAVEHREPTADPCDACPATGMGWFEAVRFANHLSRLDGYRPAYDAEGRIEPAADGWRLPTEAEWEYAARAGEHHRFAGGDTDIVGWIGAHGDSPKPVCSYAPNPWGLCDMTGNVWEWTSTWYAMVLRGGTDPTGPAEGDGRVARGGSFHTSAADAGVAYRAKERPGQMSNQLGLRLIRPAW